MKIIGIGEVVWDCFPEGKRLGGAPINFCFFAKELGAESYPVTAIGDDELGDETFAVLKETGLDLGYISRNILPTGKVLVSLNEAGVPQYDIVENVAWDAIECSPATMKLVSDADAVCWGSLAQRSVVSRETINKFLDAMPEDTLKVFDINLRQGFYTKEVLCNSFQKCNVLKINDEELVTVSRMFGYPGIDLQDKCWILLAKYNLKMLILTCGVNGSYVFTPGNVSFVETPKVNVADTVGAGDSFTATFVASILKGKTVREAHELAVEASAFVCTQNGAMPEFPLYLKEKI